ncbi:hypothetical protein NARC_10376 [Candidatus Nitrosocosmicus arcticus]|uniref:Uncharacterized protein n=1 Tax=Candidatus Nitrosocosmicus arcticus TaxID=2035267 RepID=A0A557SZD5_9ARCH|nr:hypothetical protein NARC_10376 [Candidatus Nitrosocosmicus arcticus]
MIIPGNIATKNQAGPVWFHTLSFEHPVVRACEFRKIPHY